MSLGLIGLAEVIPAIGFAFIAGFFVDKRSKRNVYRNCILFYLLNTVFIVAITSNVFREMFSVTQLELFIYTVMFLNGCIRAFLGPASFSLLPLLVKKEYLPQAITWSSTSWMLGSVLGPLAGGVMMAFVGIQHTILMTGVILIFSLWNVQRIRSQPPLVAAQKDLISGLKEGFRFVFKTEIVLAVLSLDLFAVLFGGAEALLPVFSKEILHVGEIGYGWLRSAHGIGSLFLLILLTYIPLKRRVGYKLLLSVFAYGACMILFGLSVNFYLSFACLFMAGAFDAVSVVIRHSILQLHTPEGIKGRVSSINLMFISSSNELGAFESGLAARYLGTSRSVVVGGMLTALVVIMTYFKAPSLRKLNLKSSVK